MSLKDIFIDKGVHQENPSTTCYSSITGQEWTIFLDKKTGEISGLTPLARLVLEGKLETAKRAIDEMGYDVEASGRRVSLLEMVLEDHHYNKYNNMLQVLKNIRAKVDFLLENGADVNKVTDPLTDALILGDEVIAKKIVQHGLSDDKIKSCINRVNDPKFSFYERYLATSNCSEAELMAFLTNVVGKERMASIQNEMANAVESPKVPKMEQPSIGAQMAAKRGQIR